MANHISYGSIDELITKVIDVCKERDFTLIGFVGDNCEGKQTKLVLKCNKCGYQWRSTSISNLLKRDRMSHTCGRKSPSTFEVKFYKSNAENRVNEALEGTQYSFISFEGGEYIGSQDTHVFLKCSKCGKEFRVKYSTVINGIKRCPSCSRREDEKSVVGKILKVSEDYEIEFLGFNSPSKHYEGKRTKLILKCLKCGYVWKTTSVGDFIHNKIRCRRCSSEWKSEYDVDTALSEANIEFEHDYRKFEWLKNKIRLSLDFYIPSINVGIECQGIQHFKPNNRFGGEDAFKETLFRDTLKNTLCKENGVELIYYTTLKKYDTFLGEPLFKDRNELISYIDSRINGK